MQKVLAAIYFELIFPALLVGISVALIMFAWGILDMVINSDSEEKLRNGRKHLLWGVVGFAIVLSAWGIKLMVEETVKSIF